MEVNEAEGYVMYLTRAHVRLDDTEWDAVRQTYYRQPRKFWMLLNVIECITIPHERHDHERSVIEDVGTKEFCGG